ncbi:MAG: type II toxin-antitoxin system RelE/ParE family toxin [Acidobacteria bacterium]|nr:type II toxin-antitoxin system RelE/ParE family toxin [Acidobacteriota bacterium]MYH27630.1 type II toxin-antitoxin system RelE/ParE family toxin [Acidobacteriota bacterium]MYK87427.1 type II toxin-antitoxin system RelE/ParE family toxin [Acidobacteriota bacterium]
MSRRPAPGSEPVRGPPAAGAGARPARGRPGLPAVAALAETRVVFSARARRDLRRIDAPARTRIIAGIDQYARTGVGDVKPVKARTTLRLRVGDWRVFFRRSGGGRIEVDAILHRREAYRRP